MFATYLSKDHTANIFLTPEEQRVFCQIDRAHIYPVPNKWAKKEQLLLILAKYLNRVKAGNSWFLNGTFCF